MDRLTSLTVLGRIVECGGFSAAARKLNMSVTMVSNHIQALEDRLGVRLLNRTTRRVSLTEVGKMYYERSRQILLDLEEVDRMAGAENTTPQGTLRLYTNSNIVRYLSSSLDAFLNNNPAVSLDLVVGDRWVDLVEEGFDLAIRTVQPMESSMIVRKLADWRHLLVCAPSYLENHPAPQTPADLAEHACLRYSFYPYGDEWRFEAPDGEIVSQRVGGRLLTNSAEALRQMVFSGQGIMLAPSFILVDDLEGKDFVRLMQDYRPVEFSISAVYPNRHHLSSKVRVFIDMVVERFAEHRKWMNPER
jgi:DNA-binding transcriptional LysR family regulator